ncbi:MAG: pyridoxal phosphate-dependent aminotransferase family protein [Acidimicrobiia bacterium]
MSFFRDRLEAFPRLDDYRLAKAAGYWPYYKTVESASTPRFRIEGADYINFGSNNYLSLSYHPKVIEAAQAATSKYGTGVTGSRLLNGTLDLHRTLEEELADFYGHEAALVFSTGYVANVSTIAGLLGRHDYAVLDKDAHNSLLTGVQLSNAGMKRFPHNDVDRLAKILDELPEEPGKGVIVDGVYSMGGDTAPLDRMVELCRARPNTFLLSDEAHGLGVLGERGRGAAEHYGVLADVDLLTITFSKTLGSCGGAVIGSSEAIELLTLNADPFIFTASNTPGSVAAALAGLRILRDNPEVCAQLRANVVYFHGLLSERGIPVNPAESAIITIPLEQRDELSAVVLARELLEAGVFVNPVVAPAVQRGLGLIRLSLMLDHTSDLLEEAAEVIFKVLHDNDQLPV